jgi:hypothetical protein
MTFKVEGFSVPKLKERMTDLIEQNIFRPHTLIVDGVPFDKDVRPLIEELEGSECGHRGALLVYRSHPPP